MSFNKLNYTQHDANAEALRFFERELRQVAEDEKNEQERSVMASLAKCNDPTPWAFTDFIVDGDQVMIAGAPKAGKSWMAMQLALAAASGGQFLGWQAARAQKTLYLNLEIGEHMWARRLFLQLGSVENAGKHTQFFSRCDLRTIDVMDPAQARDMREYIARKGFEFVVIDVLSRCHSADENDNGSMKAVLFALRYMCGNATSVVVHHARKPPPGSEHVNLGAGSIRGASSIVGEVDLALVLVKRAGQGARYSLTLTARNVEVPDELLLDVTDNMTFKEHEGDDNNLESVIATAFRRNPKLTASELRSAVATGLGVTEGTARNHVNQAVSVGLIVRHQDPADKRMVFYTPADNAPFLRLAAEAEAYAKASTGYAD